MCLKAGGKALYHGASLCFHSQTTILDSLVVRISACHVEGPGSIPGRGVHILLASSTTNFLPTNVCKHLADSLSLRARVAQSVER